MITTAPALPEDVDLLFSLNQDLIDRYEDTAAIDYPKVLQWLRRNLELTLPCFHRVLADGKLAGFYSLIPGETSWEIDSLFVFPEFQNKGIGTWVLNRCRMATSLPLVLYVFQKNTGAVRLYKRMGFEIAREIGTTRYIMEWKSAFCHSEPVRTLAWESPS